MDREGTGTTSECVESRDEADDRGASETRQMIEGRLAEEHEPKNVLVDVIESAPDERTIKLRDEGGVILEATASEEAGEGREPSGERSHCESEEEEEDSGGACGAREEPTLREKELITELEAVRNRTRELEAELDRVIKDHQRSEELLTEEVSRLCSKVRGERYVVASTLCAIC